MDQKKTLLVVNPVSGTGSKDKILGEILSKLEIAGFLVHLALTQYKGHAAELVRQAVADGYGSVLVCGGDGTVNESASALCGTGVAMGIIPSGSGNGLARHLGIPIDELKSVDVITHENVVACDCGEVRGTTVFGKEAALKFFCTCGIGFDALVSRKFASDGKRGKITYIKKVIEEFAKYKTKHYRITMDGEPLETDAFVVACCNASQYGNNAFIAPQASITDGMLDLVVLKNSNALQTLVAGFDLITGMVPFNRDVETHRVKSISIDLNGPAWAHVDGEPVAFGGHAEARVLPGELLVYCDPIKEQVTPFITPIDLALRDFGIAIEKLFKKHK